MADAIVKVRVRCEGIDALDAKIVGLTEDGKETELEVEELRLTMRANEKNRIELVFSDVDVDVVAQPADGGV